MHNIPCPHFPCTRSMTQATLPTVATWIVLFSFTACGGIRPLAGEDDWPFYSLRDITPPAADGSTWVRNEVDQFILAKLQKNGLSPAPEANPRQLIRRLYFDLIGLPPTPSQIQDFLESDKKAADQNTYEELVDRLLEDPRYGERWARFWLDLARYADTAGYEGDPDLPHAWRYRDYVIDAFNDDKRYDEFIKEQIAGDEFEQVMGAGELPIPPSERIVALTFLRLAPFTEPRGDESRHELLSEMTSTVSSVFLGLTIGCAKCHDHKHDPIPTEDFYRMKSFFSTIQIPPPARGDAYQIGGSIPANFYREGEAEWAKSLAEKLQQDAASASDKLAVLKRTITRRIQLQEPAGAGFGMQAMLSSGNDYFYAERNINDNKPHVSIVQSDGKEWSVFTDGKRSSLGSLAGNNRGLWFAALDKVNHLTLGQHTAGTGTPQGSEHLGKVAEILIYDHPLSTAEREQISAYFANKINGSKADKNSKTLPRAGLRFWLDAAHLDGNPKTKNPASGQPVLQWIDRISGIELRQENPELQPTLATMGNRHAPAVQFEKDLLVASTKLSAFREDSNGSIVILHSAKHVHEGYGLEIGGDGQFLSTFVNPSANRKQDIVADMIRSGDPRITREETQQYLFLTSRNKFVKQHLKRLTPEAMSLRHSFGPPYEPGVPESRIMIRGEYDNPGEAVEAGFPRLLTGNSEAATIRLDPFKRWPTRSRRMALAEWIASPDNPMTARVLVNRLWQRHFGQGIVLTPSDFGSLSGGPSHQQLLDWLAKRFVEGNWSIKELHRTILNSATYRQSSMHENSDASQIDPDNRLLWKFNRQRLDAEAIRDSVLAISGRLSPETHGLPIFPPLSGNVADVVKYDQSKWDTQYGREGKKRSIYIYQQRTLTMPLMQTFDALVCDESRPRRRTSVTPLQALAMANGEFIHDEAKHFAERISKTIPQNDNEANVNAVESLRITKAFELALGRLPTNTEVQTLRDLIRSSASPESGLTAMCRVLLNTNEFIHID